MFPAQRAFVNGDEGDRHVDDQNQRAPARQQSQNDQHGNKKFREDR